LKDYAADVAGFLAGGDATGSQTMADLVNQAFTQCPSTKVVMSGYRYVYSFNYPGTLKLTGIQSRRTTRPQCCEITEQYYTGAGQLRYAQHFLPVSVLQALEVKF
jgi:hypothetical protein